MDTENPVCLALFSPKGQYADCKQSAISPQKSNFIYLYENDN
jgi:hypothetical protein